MSRIIYFFCLVSIALSLGGCEKVIELKLDDTEPRLVIDANINDEYDNQIVRISKTYSFTDPNRFNAVEGAKVVLTTLDGDVIEYTESSPGTYLSPRMRGKPGTEYTIKVDVEGKTYTSVSRMPYRVQLDSLTFKQFIIFGGTNTYVAANFDDPVTSQDEYRYILKIKNKIEVDAVSDDHFNNGNTVSNILYHELDDLNPGDSLEVELQCINRDVYKYFFSWEQNTGDGGPPVAPANPPSNFDNGALGVFNAYTSSKRTGKIK